MFKFAKFSANLVLIFAITMVVLTSFLTGYIKGFIFGQYSSGVEYQKLLDERVSSTVVPSESPAAVVRNVSRPTWGGPDLWEAVNKRRVELGVNPLSSVGEVCTIASIRLNQLLEIGKLDGHAGFSSLPEDRPDLVWIFEKYNLTEFLVSGAESAQEAVSLWENTLGHRELVSGGQYVWGCIYAQSGFGVAITAY
jgi:hypothetical protein